MEDIALETQPNFNQLTITLSGISLRSFLIGSYFELTATRPTTPLFHYFNMCFFHYALR